MEAPDTSPAARLAKGAGRPARLVRMICQMILGAGLAVTLILKVYMAVLTDHACAVDGAGLGNLIRCTPTLTLMAYVLGLSAGFDLAGRLFSESLDRAVAPVLLGVGATFLAVLGGMQAGGAGWRDALVIAALLVSIGGLAWIRSHIDLSDKR